MTKKEKLLKRFLGQPKDFTWEELTTLLTGLGFVEEKGGKTGGSRRRFINSTGIIISLHKPHPHNNLKKYQMEQVKKLLQEQKLI
ncbi:MAG: type II toxin-antitoxin system HicA family toxin [Crocosphaera sp.]|nr:type II toxin-antitoxin system HicA family toxin [Crocosphaera sp.]